MESFFSSLNTERTARKVYRTRNDARADVVDIERFYNPRRRHSTLDNLSPFEFEERAEGGFCPSNCRAPTFRCRSPGLE
jgi:putative transposase